MSGLGTLALPPARTGCFSGWPQDERPLDGLPLRTKAEATLIEESHGSVRIRRGEDQQAQDEAQMESDHLGLKPTEQVLLWRMLEQGPRFRPDDAEALRFYRDKLGRPVSVQQAQKALESLRQRTPALVWKSARGEYAVEDAAMHRWYQGRFELGGWPPSDVRGELTLGDG